MVGQTKSPAGRQHHNLTLAALALAGLSYSLMQTMVAPALPEMQRALHTSPTGVTWILTAFLLSSSVATPIVGRLGDMFGKERLLLVVQIVFAVGVLLDALSHSLGVLIVGRVVQGLGGAIFPLAFGIIRDELPREKVGTGIGMISAILGVGGGLGLVLAGVIVDHLSYEWLFWFALVLIVVAIVTTHRFVPESPIKTPARINWSAGLLLALGLTGLMLAVSEGQSWGWGSTAFLGLLVASIAVLGAWVRSELHAPEPLVDMRMMRLRGVWTTNLAALLLGFGMFASFVLVPQLVQMPAAAGYGFHATVTQAGLFMLPASLTMLVAGPAAGVLGQRLGARTPMLLGSALAALSFFLLAALHAQSWQIYLATAVMGVGIGLAYAAMATLIVEAVPQEQTGVATGINTIARSVGGAFGSQVVATIIAGRVLARTGLPAEGGFTAALIVAAVGVLIGCAVALAIPGRRPARATGDQPAAA